MPYCFQSALLTLPGHVICALPLVLFLLILNIEAATFPLSNVSAYLFKLACYALVCLFLLIICVDHVYILMGNSNVVSLNPTWHQDNTSIL